MDIESQFLRIAIVFGMFVALYMVVLFLVDFAYRPRK